MTEAPAGGLPMRETETPGDVMSEERLARIETKLEALPRIEAQLREDVEHRISMLLEMERLKTKVRVLTGVVGLGLLGGGGVSAIAQFL